MIKLPGRIIELFGRFRQLNSILNENWRDVASKDFFSNFVDPVNSGWKTFHRQVDDASNSLKRLSNSMESAERNLLRSIDRINAELSNSPLQGYVHCTILSYSSIDFLMPPGSDSGSEEGRREYASRIDPSIDESTIIGSKGSVI